MATKYKILAIVDRSYRGAVEAQFFDALYGVLDLHPQLGQVDMAFRGTAVTLAVDERSYQPEVQLGQLRLDTPHYRNSVRTLVAEGVGVLVDEPDLRALGFGPDQVVPGVTCLASAELAARWPAYDEVWFL